MSARRHGLGGPLDGFTIGPEKFAYRKVGCPQIAVPDSPHLPFKLAMFRSFSDQRSYSDSLNFDSGFGFRSGVSPFDFSLS